ncbi:hypothetical protein [Streptomyces sp. SID9727]|uniref:hypothetical protein n=1 Tax=Streptomyces sp. SID9727 TaxID=2706114 RepID=UPI0013CD8122|nr:hypothetical protein [Streptomyces sp. SID9727]
MTGTAAAALAAAALGLGAVAPSAYGDEQALLRITPASAVPGATVTVDTTACGGDSAATGDASALDAPEFPLAPASLEEALAGSFRVPGGVAPGSYGIGVDCANGKKATGEIEVKAADRAAGTEDPAATADSPTYDFSDLEGLGGDEDTEGLDGLDAEAAGSGLVPDAPAEAGRTTPTERPTGSGRDETGTGRDESGAGRETPSGHRTSAAPTAPSGHVKTGVGGSVGPDTTQIAAGAGVLAAAAVGGAWLLRRRASGTRDAG